MKEFLKKIARGIVKGAIYIYCKVVYRFNVIGKENIPREGKVIICGNHKSFLDPPLIEVTCRKIRKIFSKRRINKKLFFGVIRKSI